MAKSQRHRSSLAISGPGPACNDVRAGMKGTGSVAVFQSGSITACRTPYVTPEIQRHLRTGTGKSLSNSKYSPPTRHRRVREMFGSRVMSQVAKRAQWPSLIRPTIFEMGSDQFEVPVNAAVLAMSLQSSYVVPFGRHVLYVSGQ